MTEFLAGLVVWVCLQMGVSPMDVEKINFVPVTAEQMAVIDGCAPDETCKIYPASSDVNNNVFYVREYEGKVLDYQHDRKLSSYIVHHITHQVQFQKLKKDPKQFMANFMDLERQADKLEKVYAASVGI